MISYKQLVEKTMQPEKRRNASRCVVGHYLVRPISNLISIPFIERKTNPTLITKFSLVFAVIPLVSFLFGGEWGFWIGWLSILVWNILDGVDGNIARFNDCCSSEGELWDVFVGWVTTIAFYVGMGFTAYYQEGKIHMLANMPDYYYIFMGDMAALAWIFPRLMMQKKMTVFGKESVAAVQDRGHYGIGKLIVFNVTSINGLASVLFLLSYLLGIMELCMIGYFILIIIIAFGSLWTLLK
jgi:phosphatidylglycerophosphate synthase